MLNLLELEQLVAFADWGTLSKAAEELHISQPTITRTMKNIETAFGVPLFARGKNKIELNETGNEPWNRPEACLPPPKTPYCKCSPATQGCTPFLQSPAPLLPSGLCCPCSPPLSQKRQFPLSSADRRQLSKMSVPTLAKSASSSLRRPPMNFPAFPSCRKTCRSAFPVQMN